MIALSYDTVAVEWLQETFHWKVSLWRTPPETHSHTNFRNDSESSQLQSINRQLCMGNCKPLIDLAKLTKEREDTIDFSTLQLVVTGLTVKGCYTEALSICKNSIEFMMDILPNEYKILPLLHLHLYSEATNELLELLSHTDDIYFAYVSTCAVMQALNERKCSVVEVMTVLQSHWNHWSITFRESSPREASILLRDIDFIHQHRYIVSSQDIAYLILNDTEQLLEQEKATLQALKDYCANDWLTVLCVGYSYELSKQWRVALSTYSSVDSWGIENDLISTRTIECAFQCAQYDTVIRKCQSILSIHPERDDLYSAFVKSLLKKKHYLKAFITTLKLFKYYSKNVTLRKNSLSRLKSSNKV